MATIKGDRFPVRLGASQVRRRLKGRGLGVRKVQSAGRGEAVIIHTATGQHKRELYALFEDVHARPIEKQESETAPTTAIEDLPNLGPASVAWLRGVGVHSRADLQRLGPVLAYRLVKQRHPRCSLSLLWAMQGALTGQDWRELTEATRRRLRSEVDHE